MCIHIKKQPPDSPTPGQPQRMQAPQRTHALLTTTIATKIEETKRKSGKICARGYSGGLVGVETAQMTTCKGRGRVQSAMRVAGGAARRVQCKGREVQGAGGHTFPMKISLPSSTNGDVTYAGGMVLKNTFESGCLPTCDSKAHCASACSNTKRAATARAP